MRSRVAALPRRLDNQRMSLAELTSVAAVRAALQEFDDLGREAFLARYGFGAARIRRPRSRRGREGQGIPGDSARAACRPVRSLVPQRARSRRRTTIRDYEGTLARMEGSNRNVKLGGLRAVAPRPALASLSEARQREHDARSDDDHGGGHRPRGEFVLPGGFGGESPAPGGLEPGVEPRQVDGTASDRKRPELRGCSRNHSTSTSNHTSPGRHAMCGTSFAECLSCPSRTWVEPGKDSTVAVG